MTDPDWSDRAQRIADYESIQATTEVPCHLPSEVADKPRPRTSVVKLIVKLEQLAKVGVPTLRRIQLLRTFDARIDEIERQIAKHSGARSRTSNPAQGLCIEHRLDCLMTQNLKLALVALDRSLDTRAQAAPEDRPWLIRRLFDFFAKSIELSLVERQPWAPGVWVEMHELYFYLLYRQDAGIDEVREWPDETFDPELAYKRLLLLGLVAQVRDIPDLSELLRQLPAWAEQARLKDPRIYGGVFNVYLVEIAKDQPPALCPNVVQATSGAWILELPRPFLQYFATLPKRSSMGPADDGGRAR